ncbi:MAG: YidC/Oxa1 family membrane protein insertase [bacterium]|jgi:YidC/Oxa1 family membrane protein insertase
MDKNLLSAFVLSTIIIVGYYLIFPPQKPKAPKKSNIATQQQKLIKKQQSTTATAKKTEIAKATSSNIALSTPRKTVTVTSNLYQAKIDTYNGALTSFQLLQHKYALPQKTNFKDYILGMFTGSKSTPVKVDPTRLIEMIGDTHGKNYPLSFQIQKNQTTLPYTTNKEQVNVTKAKNTVTLVARTKNNIEIRKTLTFSPNSYEIELNIQVINRSGSDQIINPSLLLGAGNEAVQVGKNLLAKKGISFVSDDFETYDDDDAKEGKTISAFSWVGTMDTYFITALKTKDAKLTAVIDSVKSKLQGKDILIPNIKIEGQAIQLNKGKIYNQQHTLYIGAKETEQIQKFHPEFLQTLDLTFGFLAHPLLATLRWLQGIVHNWGIAIIILTILVRLILFPLAFKGMMSMQKMSKLNPRMKVLREKYKGNKEKLNQEIMELYRKNKVNPVGGCFPLLMQVPIFIALYSALLPAIELRHQPFFLWMSDLSAADHTLVLPILMGVSMFIQQRLTPTAAMEPTQEKMMKWFPVIMTFFFLDFSSGLVLYWVVSNILSILQQLIFNRVKTNMVS